MGEDDEAEGDEEVSPPSDEQSSDEQPSGARPSGNSPDAPAPDGGHTRRAPRSLRLADEVPFAERPESTEPTSALPRRLETWRRRSASGAVFTGFAFGLREVFETNRDEPAIMIETSGTPPRDLPVEADLDDPVAARSVVRIRPWLLDEEAAPEPTPVAPDDSPSDRSPTPAPPRRTPRPRSRWGRRR